MTKFLVTGAAGMLGHDLRIALADRDATFLTRGELDITDSGAVAEAVSGHDVILNAAAYTQVDAAEEDEAAATAVNGRGPELLALAARAQGARLVTISTDYVFRGDGVEPYREDEARNPINAYGRSKAAGEAGALAAHPTGTYVVRTAWLYGRNGANFATTMLKLAATRETLSVVADQLGQPTWTRDLADQLVALADGDAPAGIYHGTNAGRATWYDFARAVFEEAGLDPDRVQPTDSTQFVRPAARPAFSVLGHDAWRRAGLAPMRDWREALADAATQGVLNTDDDASSSR